MTLPKNCWSTERSRKKEGGHIQDQSLRIDPPTVAHPTLTQSPGLVLDLVPIHAPNHVHAQDHDLGPDRALVPTPRTLEEAEVVATAIVPDPAHLRTIAPEHALLLIEGGMVQE